MERRAALDELRDVFFQARFRGLAQLIRTHANLFTTNESAITIVNSNSKQRRPTKLTVAEEKLIGFVT